MMDEMVGRETAESRRTAAAIEVEDLVVNYGRKRAVDGLNLAVPRGSVYGFLGPNGAGKTTTIKTLMGFRGPNGGRASVLGYDVVEESLEVRARVGFASEINSLYDGMTVRRLCEFCRDVSRSWDQALVDRYIGVFGLPSEGKVRKLSKGQKAQLQLCVALGSDPEVLILDEPTSGLDPVARHAFLKVFVGDVAAGGRTVFFSTHILSDIEAVADTIGITKGGRLLVSGDLDEMHASHRTFRIVYADTPPEEEIQALRDLPGVTRVERVLLTKYALNAGGLFVIVMLGSVTLLSITNILGYPQDAIGVFISAVLMWLGLLFILGTALVLSIVFDNAMLATIGTFLVWALTSLVPAFIAQQVTVIFMTSQGQYPATLFDALSLSPYWTSLAAYSGDSFPTASLLVSSITAALPLLAALWLFNRKTY